MDVVIKVSELEQYRKELENQKGIYLIRVNGYDKFYVGSTTKSFYERWNKHLTLFRNKKHCNKHLQHIYNKYGEKSFNFCIYEIVENISQTIAIEQKWIDVYWNSGLLFNCHSRADVPTNKGNKQTPEQIKHRNKLRGWDKGYIVIDPLGKEYIFDYIPHDFCKEHNLIKNCLYAVANGKRYMHKNWFCRHRDPDKIKIRKARPTEYILINPKGIEFEVKNLTKFAKENNIRGWSDLWSIAKGTSKSSHADGWKIRYRDESKIPIKQLKIESIKYVVTLPSGEEVKVSNLAQFCRDSLDDLKADNFYKVLNGKKCKTYKKYKLRKATEDEIAQHS